MRSPMINFTTIVALLWLAACDYENTSVQAAEGAAVPACAACHEDELNFTGRDADEIAAQIKAIRDGKIKHPPLKLADLSDAAILELAKTLTAE